MKFILILGVFIFVLCDTQVNVEGKKRSESRIIGGEKVKDIANYPYTAVLIDEWGHSTTFMCACGKVSRYFVLTAAQCITPRLKAAFERGGLLVRGNTLKWQEYRGDDHEVINIKKHHQYNKTSYDADVAALKVKTPFARGSWLTLPPKSMYDKGSTVRTFGWGSQTMQGETPVMDDLFTVTISIQDIKKCNKTFLGSLTRGMFCAGADLQGPCTHDQGGPVMITAKDRRQFIIGLVSFTYNRFCGLSAHTNIFTNLYHFRQWVLKAIGQPQKIPDAENSLEDD